VPNGWTDWISTVQIAVEGMTQIGINAKIATPESPVWQQQLTDGTFQAAINSWHSGATPYYTYSEAFNEANKGKTRFTGHRFTDPKVQELLGAYEATADAAKQHDIVHALQARIADQLPILPVFNNPIWYEYSTRNFTGWTTKDNPWIDPSSYSVHYRILQLLALRPVAK
jgi:peptide/nickel transport system substrate-binding protein